MNNIKLDKAFAFRILSQYIGADIYTSSDDFNATRFESVSFDRVSGCVNTLHPRSGLKIGFFPLDHEDGSALILNRMKDMTPDDACALAQHFMNWKEEYVWHAGHDDSRIIVGYSPRPQLEFNIGINQKDGKFWCMHTGLGEQMDSPNIQAGYTLLTQMGYGFDWMFSDNEFAFAIDAKVVEKEQQLTAK